ncbi:PREDICTED: parathyroid hormone-like [Dipodomys ordii]|uniref:Parathyroid hormone-like n=1 Tax=Dipodomys ordii TaxID=10020 RepID=A0A1S3G7W7_DIPOR|nr:PREDICTED: parathyroid hormone-like [Dipodomys ordii]
MSTKDMAKIIFAILAICFLTKTDGKLIGSRMRNVTPEDMLACVNEFVTNEERHTWLTSYLEQMKVLSVGNPGPHSHEPEGMESNNPANSSQGSTGETGKANRNVLLNAET